MSRSATRMLACPECNNFGSKVKRVTLESLLRADRRADIGDGPHRVCLTPECETVYFGAASFVKSDLLVRFGLKENGSPRPVCYCFDHSVEGIHDEIRRTGRSTVLDSIKAAMKGSGCRCEYTNPLGSCCLKSVGDVVAQGFELSGREDTSADSGMADGVDCCCPPQDVDVKDMPPDRAGVVAAGGSVLAAVLSSACCWLPLLLIAFGVSAAGLAGFFEAYRPYLIAGAVVLLGLSYYRVYLRPARCAGDAGCAGPSRKLRVVSRIMLWSATVLVGAFIFFPNYAGYLLAAQRSETPLPIDAQSATVQLRIEGMTCQGCASILQRTLAALPDVKSVEVEYPSGRAVIRYDSARPVPHDRISQAVKTAGYRTISNDDSLQNAPETPSGR